MDEEPSAIEFKDVSLGDTVKLRISLKTLENNKFLDVRKWLKYPNLPYFIPTKKGLMLTLKDWKQVIPMIEALLKEYSSEDIAKAA